MRAEQDVQFTRIYKGIDGFYLILSWYDRYSIIIPLITVISFIKENSKQPLCPS